MSSIELHKPDNLAEPATRDKNYTDPALTRRLKGKTGKEYWRSLEELADTKEFRRMVRKQFPSQAAEFLDSVSRRRFLKLMGASLALAGISGCSTKPTETIVPYVERPEGLIPGRPLFYATAMIMGGATNGLLVEQHEGRPTKIEGNPSHPNSLGATDVFAQASVLSMYDPDRSDVIRKNGAISTYDQFIEEFRGTIEGQRPGGGSTVRILTETVVSPTLSRQLNDIFKRFPNAQVHHYESAGGDSAREGNQIAFGQPVNTFYKLTEADVILSLDEDFLYGFPHNVRYIHDWASRRRPEPGVELNRTYVVESTHTATGAKADHRMPMRARDIEAFARVLADRLGVDVGSVPQLEVDERYLNALVSDLRASAGRSVVIPGRHQPAAVHALAHAMNETLRNVGTTVYHTESVEHVPANPGQPAAERPTTQVESLRALTEDMRQGKVKVLLIVGGNPVYSAPADIEFGKWLAASNNRNERLVPLSVHLSEYRDETSELAVWHIPQTHYLEAWSDARTFDGTVSIVQPLIEPLYSATRTPHDLLSLFSDLPDAGGAGGASYDLVRETVRSLRPNVNFEELWRQSLLSGVVDGSELPIRPLRVRPGLAGRLPALTRDSGGLEVVFRPDPSLYDGRWANNGWLQELPKPISKLTWDNAVMLAPATAHELGVKVQDVVTLTLGGRAITAPVFELAGQPAGTATLHLGYGRNVAGGRFRVGNNIGFNVNTLRTSTTMNFGTGASIQKTGDTYELATTQRHHLIEDLDQGHVRHATVEEYRRNPQIIKEESHHVEGSLYPEYDYENPNFGNRHAYRWGMAIDMSTCTGCNACVIACQAENNVPVVGKEQVGMSREMHWLRIDSYFRGDEANPETYFQPMMCVHCEKAPCEVVCPVEATVHNIEGLNDMIYNRCVGTKYCSNNCPYKVRRFNWFQLNDKETPQLKMMRNPDVTVRERGVMEKCTYCVQRISRARINAEREDRRVGGNEIKTACHAACPAGAIIFGDLNDPQSTVSRLHHENRSYPVLGQINTQPRTQHLAEITNPNLAIGPSESSEEHTNG